MELLDFVLFGAVFECYFALHLGEDHEFQVHFFVVLHVQSVHHIFESPDVDLGLEFAEGVVEFSWTGAAVLFVAGE